MHTNILWPQLQLYIPPVPFSLETKRSLTYEHVENTACIHSKNLVWYKVTLAGLLTTLYRNKCPDIYNSKHPVYKLIYVHNTHSINLNAQQITRFSTSGSDRIIITYLCSVIFAAVFYFERLQQKLTLFFSFSWLLFLLLFFAAGFRFNKGTAERIIRLNSRLIKILGLFLLLFLARLWKGYRP